MIITIEGIKLFKIMEFISIYNILPHGLMKRKRTKAVNVNEHFPGGAIIVSTVILSPQPCFPLSQIIFLSHLLRTAFHLPHSSAITLRYQHTGG